MQPDVVVMTAPDFDDCPCLGAASEPFDRQAFVAEFPVEALIRAVLPGFAGVDRRYFDSFVEQPFEDRVTDELRPVVRTQVTRSAVRGNQACQHLDP